MKILLVEDEKKVSSFIKKGLEEEYYTVDVAFDGKEGLKLASTQEYDLMVLDLMIPYIDGISLLKEVRKENTKVPILILTAKSVVGNKVEGLDSGADDYLTKPFAFEELIARVRALLRRSGNSRERVLKAADLEIDIESHKVRRNGNEIILTPKNIQFLNILPGIKIRSFPALS